MIGLDFKKYVEQLVNIGRVMHYSSNKSIINVRRCCECASAGGLAAHMCLHTGKCLITVCVRVSLCVRVCLQIDQEGLTLPERSLYLGQDEESVKVINLFSFNLCFSSISFSSKF